MSAREWTPGDVAVISIPGRGDVRAMFMDGGTWETPEAEADGATTYRASPPYDRGLTGRPLVVIDPEDREQVSALARAIRETTPDDSLTDIASALRSLVAPLKPDEPIGVGAVVEDADGAAWVLVDRRRGVCGWRHVDSYKAHQAWRTYEGIAAVKVLSEGVST